ncbi:MAG: exodeoxyribonuclease VII small subunit [Verrucomicrobiota bacterium JB022]|nr:exodeoxyribonuclease VII small subunit [Verrucomicrobiota bacterium JB022]
MSSAKESAQAEDQPLAFEAALDQLEALVTAMEAGELPLATLVAKYEEGSKLVKVCEARLKDAELKIEKLREGGDNVSFEPMQLPQGGE